MKKALGAIVLAGALALGIGGCSKEKEYRVEMENGYICHADFHESQDHIWVDKGKQTIGVKTINRCMGDNCGPAVSYAVNTSETSNDILEVMHSNGILRTDLSWYEDPEVRKEYEQIYSLIKQCEQLLEQKYKKDF